MRRRRGEIEQKRSRRREEKRSTRGSAGEPIAKGDTRCDEREREREMRLVHCKTFFCGSALKNPKPH